MGVLEVTLTPGVGKEGGDVIFLHKSVLFIEGISAYSLCDKFSSFSTQQQQQETAALYNPSLPPDPYTTAALLLSHSATLERTHPSLSLTHTHYTTQTSSLSSPRICYLALRDNISICPLRHWLWLNLSSLASTICSYCIIHSLWYRYFLAFVLWI